MLLTVRSKLVFMVGIIAASYFLLIGAGWILYHRAEMQLAQIRETYLPMVELGPKLENQFEHLRRGFQDAVGSQDAEALTATQDLKETLLTQITEARGSLEQKQIDSLKTAVGEYYDSASEVSKRLLQKETGESLVEAMAKMQARQTATENLLGQFTQVDKTKLAGAFAAIGTSLTVDWQIRLLIAVLSSILVLTFSTWIGRGIFRSLAVLSNRLEQFGKGDFSTRAEVLSDDELGQVAKQANQMAGRIQALMKEVESFSYSVAHDLRAPLRSVLGFSNILLEDFATDLPPTAQKHLERIAAAAKNMGNLIDSLLGLSRLNRKEMVRGPVDLSELAAGAIDDLHKSQPERKVTTVVAPNVRAQGDSQLLQIVLVNLIGNAWKFTAKKPDARIEFGREEIDGQNCFYVRDNGAGFDMRYATQLFGTFQRLHSNSEFEGTGIGLATVQSIIHRHGGKIWAIAQVDHGAEFRFTIG